MNIWAWIYIIGGACSIIFNIGSHVYKRDLAAASVRTIIEVICATILYFGFIHHG